MCVIRIKLVFSSLFFYRRPQPSHSQKGQQSNECWPFSFHAGGDVLNLKKMGNEGR